MLLLAKQAEASQVQVLMDILDRNIRAREIHCIARTPEAVRTRATQLHD